MNQKPKEKTGQLDENTKQWLESRPELLRRLKEMKRICENEGREHELLAKAEAGLVEQLDEAGRELVGAWLEKREEQEHAKAQTQMRMREHSKKTAGADGIRGTRYACSMEGVGALGHAWAWLAKQSGWGQDTQIHVVGDGACRVGQQARKNVGPNCRVLVDFYHLSEYLSAVAQRHKTGEKGWLKRQQKRLKKGCWKQVMKEWRKGQACRMNWRWRAMRGAILRTGATNSGMMKRWGWKEA
jgi:hypothetical protein